MFWELWVWMKEKQMGSHEVAGVVSGGTDWVGLGHRTIPRFSYHFISLSTSSISFHFPPHQNT
jgi:hypothetical protein